MVQHGIVDRNVMRMRGMRLVKEWRRIAETRHAVC